MTYRALVTFTDLQDGNYKYSEGDTYPRAGYDPPVIRVAELLSNKNRRGMPVIESVEDSTGAEKPKRRKRKTEDIIEE